MKILLIGASGTVGSAIDHELSQRHEIIRIGRKSGEFQVDISDSASIRKLFQQTGNFDALSVDPFCVIAAKESDHASDVISEAYATQCCKG